MKEFEERGYSGEVDKATFKKTNQPPISKLRLFQEDKRIMFISSVKKKKKRISKFFKRREITLIHLSLVLFK